MLAARMNVMTPALEPGDQLTVTASIGHGEVFVVENLAIVNDSIMKIEGTMHLIDVHGQVLSSEPSFRWAGRHAAHDVIRLIST